MKNLAIQGVHGCFHEEAGRLFYDNQISINECLSFEEMFIKLENKEVDALIMAIENTVAGGLLPNYTLLKKYEKKIKGEVYIRIKQNLMALPGQTIEDIKEVHSHYMAIAQTREYFNQYPHIKLVESEDTAKAAADIAKGQKKNMGAIASELSSEIFNLEIIAPSIETHKQNFTRFLIIDEELEVKENEINKASICFSLPHKAGRLSQVLSIFTYYDLNLTKIQSLPLVGKEWQYFFYVDLKFDDYKHYKDCLNAVRPLLDEFTIMGEYKSMDNE